MSAKIIKQHIDTFSKDVQDMITVQKVEEEATDDCGTVPFNQFDASKRLAASGEVIEVKGKKLTLVSLHNPTTRQRDSVEIQVPMKLMYDFEPGKKITLRSLSNPELLEFLKATQERALQIACETCPYGWTEEDMRDFGKWSFPNVGQLKLQIKLGSEDATQIFSFDPERREYAASDTTILRKGSIVYPVISFRFVWFSTDSCGLSYGTDMLAVIPMKERGFDFITGGTETSNATNRLFSTMDPGIELDFTRDKYVNPKLGNVSYYFNGVEDFQMPRARSPFGFQENDQNPGSMTGSVELDVCAPVKEFLNRLDHHVRTKIIENYTRWFGSKPKQLTVETLETKGIYRSTIRASKDPSRYADLYRLKIYTDPGNERRCVEVYVWDAATNSHRKGTVSDITKQCELVPIVTVSNLYFKTSGKNAVVSVGLTLHARRVLVYPKASKTTQKPSFFRNMTLVPNKRAREEEEEAEHTDSKQVRFDSDDEDDNDGFY